MLETRYEFTYRTLRRIRQYILENYELMEDKNGINIYTVIDINNRTADIIVY